MYFSSPRSKYSRRRERGHSRDRVTSVASPRSRLMGERPFLHFFTRFLNPLKVREKVAQRQVVRGGLEMYFFPTTIISLPHYQSTAFRIIPAAGRALGGGGRGEGGHDLPLGEGRENFSVVGEPK